MTASGAFLLAFPALFSIINPFGGALIFDEMTATLAPPDKVRVAGWVGLYSLLVLLGALWGGAYVLNFFGISLGALRIAGGTVVALTSWNLLMTQELHEDRKRRQAAEEGYDPVERAFFPLTMPITTGPGTIAVAITLGSARPASGIGLLGFFIGATAAAVANAAIVWVAYRSAGSIAGRLSRTARHSLARLTAFLLLCIGVQILISGVDNVVADLRLAN